MTEVIEKVAVTTHPEGDEACPFCPGKKEKEWTTTKGEGNNSTKLRNYMNKPSTNGWAQQSGARPKDGKEGRQSPDPEKPSPSPIYRSSKYGDYYDQAHHLISGNEIMKGHPIEKIITKGSDFEGDTGYTINTCANGVYLPSYPKEFSGIWGSRSYPKEYPSVDGSTPKTVNNVAEDQAFKLEVMKPAMDGSGQAHIGGHEGFYIEELDEYKKTYPESVQIMLNEVLARVKKKASECPFCTEGGEPKKPFLPPYKVNQWLDDVASAVESEITGSVSQWPYFISQIALDYAKEVKLGSQKKSTKRKLLD